MTTKPNSLRERVAEAQYNWLIANNGNGGKRPWHLLNDDTKEEYLHRADAALAVVREWMVSDAVIVEAIKHGREEMNRLHFSGEGYEDNGALWRGFMKAALQAAAKKMEGGSN